MARQNTSMQAAIQRPSTKSAIIFFRDYNPDEGTDKAEGDAASHGCKIILRKNEKYYDTCSPRVIKVDRCYTDDPEIKADYEAARIPVFELEPLKDRPKFIDPMAELEVLRAENAELKAAQTAKRGPGRPPKDTTKESTHAEA